MSEAAELVRTQARDVQAEVNYLVPGIERPRSYAFPPPEGEPVTTVVSEPHRVTIRDLRALERPAALDREGFTLVRHASEVRDFDDDAEVKAVFYPEVEDTIWSVTGAARVFIFDHTIRRRIPGAIDYSGGVPRQPVSRVHVDHTARSGPQRVRDLLPDEADELLRGRVQIINLWRPLVGPLRDFPLAVADARSVPQADLVPSDLVYPHRVGETYQVRYNPRHRWFFAPDMRPDEALLIKCFDSVVDGRARFAPHTAFADPAAGPDTKPRESIEVRALVFHPA